MELDEILLTAEESMDKAVDYLKNELRGVRTGRASTGLVEYIKVDYYGSTTDLRQLALISVPEPTQILIKPFDPGSLQEIAKAIQNAGLGLNPVVEAKQIRLSLPPLSGERRSQLIGSVRQMGEQAKVSIRNARRDANKHLDQLAKDKAAGISEDDIESSKEEVQELTKKYEAQVDELVSKKTKEIEEV
ncbi:MAG TPA: ribosome recycling factor [Phycisphaeraceae bacterium]